MIIAEQVSDLVRQHGRELGVVPRCRTDEPALDGGVVVQQDVRFATDPKPERASTSRVAVPMAAPSACALHHGDMTPFSTRPPPVNAKIDLARNQRASWHLLSHRLGMVLRNIRHSSAVIAGAISSSHSKESE